MTRGLDGPVGAPSEVLDQWRAYFMCAQVRSHVDLRLVSESCFRVFFGHPCQLSAVQWKSNMSGPYPGRKLSGCW